MILDGFRLDLTADVLVAHCIGYFRCPDEATGIVVAHADPLGALANTEALDEQPSQRGHKSPRGLLARLVCGLAGAGCTANSGSPLGGLGGSLLGLADQPVNAAVLLAVPRRNPIALTREPATSNLLHAPFNRAAAAEWTRSP